MLSHLVRRDEIAEAQTALVNLMRSEFPGVDERNITFRPTALKNQKLMTLSNYWYRASEVSGKDESSPRFLNWFGVLTPSPLHIAVEVNVLREGINPRVRGFFARDDTTGAVYLMHTGDVGGGIRGVSGKAFRAWRGEPRRGVFYEPRREVFYGDGNVRRGFIVIPLNGLDPTRYAHRYVDRIRAFKDAVEKKQVDVESAEFKRQIQELEEYEDFYSVRWSDVLIQPVGEFKVDSAAPLYRPL